MKTVTIADARAFSLRDVQRRDLVRGDDLHIDLLSFEAGQRDPEILDARQRVYQVMEGEAIVRGPEGRTRLGRGTLLSVPASTPHTLENAGGGLLVVMVTMCAAGEAG